MKNIILTGASGGIGYEIALTLADKENRLILVYNKSKAEIVKLAKKLDGFCFDIYKCNLADLTEVKRMINDIIKKYKHIDCLINCAGVSLSKLVQDYTEKDYSYIMDNNFKSCFNITKSVVPHMLHAEYGRIVNISSMWGVVGASMESLYSATKGAMNSFTLSLAKELGGSNITVNAVCPGLIDTKMNACYSKQEIEEIINASPIKRIGTPKDVANLVEFLSSDKASFITGQIITVDGGLTL